MRRAVPVALLVSMILARPTFATPPEGETEYERTFYALGYKLGMGMAPLEHTDAEFEMLRAGFADGIEARESRVPWEEYVQKIPQMLKTRVATVSDDERMASLAFVDGAAAEEGAIRTESGLVIREIVAGSGKSPGPGDKVKVHYHGMLRDGTVFDSSVDRGAPSVFAFDGVLPCWQEALGRMKVGGKSRIVCPSDLAYGDKGVPPKIQPGAALSFEVELLEIVR